jgi:hypothetical protein
MEPRCTQFPEVVPDSQLSVRVPALPYGSVERRKPMIDGSAQARPEKEMHFIAVGFAVLDEAANERGEHLISQPAMRKLLHLNHPTRDRFDTSHPPVGASVYSNWPTFLELRNLRCPVLSRFFSPGWPEIFRV